MLLLLLSGSNNTWVHTPHVAVIYTETGWLRPGDRERHDSPGTLKYESRMRRCLTDGRPAGAYLCILYYYFQG